MAHIAIVTGLLVGRIHSSFELVLRLQNEGHTITYLCQPSTQKKIETNGFLCVPVPEITFDYKDPRRKHYESSWFKKFWFHLKYWNSHYSEGKKILKLESIKKVLREVNPDLILIDFEIHDLIFTALELKIPVKLYTSWFSDTISLNSPSIRTTVTPSKGMSGTKLGVLSSWILMRLKIHGRVVLNRLKFENYRRWMFKKYAREIGFDTTELRVNTLPPLYNFTRLPIVSMTMSELEFPHKLAKNIIYVGPMVPKTRMDQTEFSPETKKLEAIFKSKTTESKKLIYCSVGSLAKGHLPFLQKVIEAVAEVEDWLLILSIGPKMNIGTFTSVPKNVHIFNWVPQLRVIEQSDCAIVSCGLNTINECIHFKVPMLLYSGRYTDQNGNAARMAYHGLGILGDILADSSEKIRMNLSQVFEQDTFKENVVRFNTIYQEYRNRKLGPQLLN